MNSNRRIPSCRFHPCRRSEYPCSSLPCAPSKKNGKEERKRLLSQTRQPSDLGLSRFPISFPSPDPNFPFLFRILGKSTPVLPLKAIRFGRHLSWLSYSFILLFPFVSPPSRKFSFFPSTLCESFRETLSPSKRSEGISRNTCITARREDSFVGGRGDGLEL